MDATSSNVIARGTVQARILYEFAMAFELPVFCPECQRKLGLLCSWTFRGAWGFNEVRTYEGAEHGPIFLTPEARVQEPPMRELQKGSDYGERDSPVLAPRKPAPGLNTDAIAIPEPD